MFLLFSGCISNNTDTILVNDNKSILYFTKDTAILYSKRSVFPAFFSKKDYSYCMNESSKIGCYDINRRNYEVCLNLSKINYSGIIIQSRDSCANQNIHLSQNEYYSINKKIRQFNWDSIQIKYDFYDKTKDKLLNRNEIAGFRANNHPFTIHEEAYFMCFLDYGVYYSESTNENPIILTVYSKGKEIKKYEGNVIPVVLRSVFECNSL